MPAAESQAEPELMDLLMNLPGGRGSDGCWSLVPFKCVQGLKATRFPCTGEDEPLAAQEKPRARTQEIGFRPLRIRLSRGEGCREKKLFKPSTKTLAETNK